MNIYKILLVTIVPLVMVSLVSCTKNNDYHISGKVIMATTGEPLEGVVVEVYNEICQGGPFNGGCGPDPDDFHSTTSNANGEFEMIFTSEESALELNFKKEFMYTFNSDTDKTGRVNSGVTSLDNASMFVNAEWFTIDFEPTISNVQEVTLGLEWNHFSGGRAENIIWGTFPSYFTIFDNPRRPTSIEHYGEQWLKMDFDILLEDGSSLQKTDSIWLPGRYYDLGFGDGPPNPVYKFTY